MCFRTFSSSLQLVLGCVAAVKVYLGPVHFDITDWLGINLFIPKDKKINIVLSFGIIRLISSQFKNSSTEAGVMGRRQCGSVALIHYCTWTELIIPSLLFSCLWCGPSFHTIFQQNLFQRVFILNFRLFISYTSVCLFNCLCYCWVFLIFLLK